MAYSVDLIYSKNQDLSNSSTETEQGQPSSIELENLDSNQTYYTKAVLKNDGVTENESSTETFTTLPAGVITLEHISTYRSGYGYDVTYRYTSTYAPSSAILSTNGTNFQGVIDSAQHAVSFWVTGLTPGTAYLTNVTLYDIYAESFSVQGSIVATVVNEIRITDTTPGETTMLCELDYVLDNGFDSGYVEYWFGDDDPSQDQPQGHEFFFNGDESVTITNLTAGTEYKFRATVVQGEQGSYTYVESTVVTASTEAGYDSKYFTISNIGNSTASVYWAKRSSNAQAQTLSVSTDNGTTWTSKTSVYGGTKLADLSSGESVLIKKTTASNGSNCIYTTGSNCELSGNIASLVAGDNYNTGSTLTMPENAFNGIFLPPYNENSTIAKADKVTFASFSAISNSGCNAMFTGLPLLTTAPDMHTITTIGSSGCSGMFNGTAIVNAPDLSNVTQIGQSGCANMFIRCTSLASVNDFDSLTTVGDSAFYQFMDMDNSQNSTITTLPGMPNVTSIGEGVFYRMFRNCTAATTPPDLSGLTSVGNSGMYQMFSGCTSLEESPDLSSVTTVGNYGMQNMFYNCTSLVEPPDLGSVTSVGNSGMRYMFSGCTSLEYCPDLSGLTSVGGQAMQYMFYNCTSITESPDLSGITSVGQNGMQYMFNNCTNMSVVYAPTVSWNTTYMSYWMANVAASGTFYVDSQYASTVPLNSASGCPTGWLICVLPIPDTSDYFRITNVSTSNNSISIYDNGTEDHVTVGVSTDGGTTWTNYTSSENGTVLATLQPYKSLIMRHTGRMGVYDSDARHQINGTGQFDISGNIASLTHSDNFDIGEELQMPDYAFYKMFDNSNVRSARYLYFDSFGEITKCSLKGLFAYSYYFVECPELMTTIYEFGTNCMESFAQGCGSLKTVPEMCPTEINEQAFVYAFYGCSSLTDASLIDFSGVGSIESGKYRFCCCQQMFEGCTNLVTPPPYLPVIASDGWAWYEFLNMFKGCSSLTSTPELNSGFTSVGESTMQEMFADCQSLTTGMDIRAITTCRGDRPSALNNMYAGCSSLTTAYAVNISNYYADENAYHWLSNVAERGTLYCPSVAIANQMPVNDVDGCPSGWAMQVGDTKILTPPTISVNSNTGTITVTGVIPTGSGAELQYKEQGASYRAYTEPLLMSNYTPPLTIYARNYTSTTGWMSSAEVRETITKYTLADPIIGYNSDTSRVTITYNYDSFANASVYYTTDGTTPTSASTLYSGTFVASTGTTVKAVAIASNTNWYNNSQVVEMEVGTVIYHDYVHLNGITSGSPGYYIGTGVPWDDTGIRIQVQAMTKGYETGDLLIGHTGADDSNTGWQYEDSIRLFNVDGGYFDFAGSRMSGIGLGATDGHEWQLEIGDNYVYDIENDTYMAQGTSQSIGNANAEIFINASTWWVAFVQIYDSNDNLLFDGSAAEYNGHCGLYDEVSGNLFYNANYPAVCVDISE